MFTRAEVKVLVAIFFSQPFSRGDDEREECKIIAKEFKRSAGTIDRQWRNIRDFRDGRPSKKTGRLVKEAVEDWLTDPKQQMNLALYWCKKESWGLKQLMEINQKGGVK